MSNHPLLARLRSPRRVFILALIPSLLLSAWIFEALRNHAVAARKLSISQEIGHEILEIEDALSRTETEARLLAEGMDLLPLGELLPALCPRATYFFAPATTRPLERGVVTQGPANGDRMTLWVGRGLDRPGLSLSFDQMQFLVPFRIEGRRFALSSTSTAFTPSAALVHTNLSWGVGRFPLSLEIPAPENFPGSKASFVLLAILLLGFSVTVALAAFFLVSRTAWLRREVERTHGDLSEIETRWRSTFESLNAGFQILEFLPGDGDRLDDWKYVDVNPAWSKITGVPAWVVRGRRARQDADQEADLYAARFKKVVEEGVSIEYEGFSPYLDRWLHSHVFRISGRLFAVVFHDISERKREEKKIADSEQKWRSLFNHLEAGLAIGSWRPKTATRTADFLIESSNPGWNRIWQGLESRSLADLLGSEAEAVISRLETVGAQGRSVEFEARSAGRSFLVSGFPTGEGSLGIMLTDVTLKNTMEANLRESEKRTQTILASLSQGVVIQNRRAEIEYCNEMGANLLGLEIDMVTGKSSFDPDWRLLKEDGRPFEGPEHPAVQTLATGRSFSNVLMGIVKPDGSATWVQIHSRPLQLASDGSVEKVIVSFSDVTLLRESQRSVQLLIDSLDDVIFQLDAKGRFEHLYTNDESALLLPWNETVGRSFEEVLPKTFPDAATHGPILEALRGAYQGRPGRSVEYPHPRISWVWFRAHISPIRNEGGEVIGTSIRISQITEEHESRAVMNLSQKVARLGSWRYLPLQARITASEGLRELLGMAEDEPFSFENLVQRIHPEDREGWRVAFLDPDPPLRREDILRYFKRSGDEGILRSVMSSERNSEGDLSMRLGTLQDVTIEMRTAQENSLMATAMGAGALVSRVSLEGDLLDANENFLKRSGYDRFDLIGRNLRMLTSGLHPAEFWKRMRETVRAGKIWSDSVCNRAKNGEFYWSKNTVVPVAGAGEITEAFVFGQDITSEKALEAKILLENRKSKDVLLKAAEFQKGYNSREVPMSNVMDLAAAWAPSEELGGDLIDCRRIGEDKIAVLIADTTGHGVLAALQTSLLRNLLDEELYVLSGSGRPALFMSALSFRMIAWTQDGLFPGLTVLVIDEKERKAVWSCAGAPPPLLLRNGELVALERPKGMHLGFEPVDFGEAERILEPGDQLILGSDGLYDLFGAGEGKVDFERMRSSFVGSLSASNGDMLSSWLRLNASRNLPDDLTIFLARPIEPQKATWTQPEDGRATAFLDRTGRVLEKAGWTEDERNQASIVLTELLVNAHSHGNKGDETKAVRLEVAVDGTSLVLAVEDEGEGFDPGKVADPTDPARLLQLMEEPEKTEILTHGRGLWLCRQFGGELRHENGGRRAVYRMKRKSRPLQFRDPPESAAGEAGD